jgi:hypothetical protein
MCRNRKPSFAPHSGDDLGIATAIKLCLPQQIGTAVSSASLDCAAIDMWLYDESHRKNFRMDTGSFETRVYNAF